MERKAERPVGGYAEMVERINQIVVDKLGVEASNIHENSLLKDDFGADSLDVADVQVEISREFSLSFVAEDEFKKMSDMYDFYRTKLNV